MIVRLKTMLALRKCLILAEVAVTVCAACSRDAVAPVVKQFFDWEVPDVYPTGPSNIIPVPLLDDGNAGAVDTYFSTRPAGSTLAVKVLAPLSAPATLNIFNKYKVNYVFADFEGTDALVQT